MLIVTKKPGASPGFILIFLSAETKATSLIHSNSSALRPQIYVT